MAPAKKTTARTTKAATAKKAPAKKITKKTTAKAPAKKKVKKVTQEQIRERAYEIYERNGGQGSDLDHWIQAEKELGAK